MKPTVTSLAAAMFVGDRTMASPSLAAWRLWNWSIMIPDNVSMAFAVLQRSV